MVTETRDLICLRFDVDSEPGKRVAGRYRLRALPTILFLEPNGSPRDSIVGYLPTNLFKRELRRIESGEGTIPDCLARIAASPNDPRFRLDLITRLYVFGEEGRIESERAIAVEQIEGGVGYDPQSVDELWQLRTRLRKVGMDALAAKQEKAIARLDPEGVSLPGRWLRLERAVTAIRVGGQDAAMREFLADETEPELLYAGWRQLQGFCKWKISRTKEEKKRRHWWEEWRLAATRTWEYVPDSERAYVANEIAWTYYEDAEHLTPEERRLALELATVGARLAPEEVNTLDTYACCLYLCGRVQEAIEAELRCIRLDPENEMWRERLESFRGAGR